MSTTTIIIPSVFTSADAAEYISQEIQGILDLINWCPEPFRNSLRGELSVAVSLGGPEWEDLYSLEVDAQEALGLVPSGKEEGTDIQGEWEHRLDRIEGALLDMGEKGWAAIVAEIEAKIEIEWPGALAAWRKNVRLRDQALNLYYGSKWGTKERDHWERVANDLDEVYLAWPSHIQFWKLGAKEELRESIQTGLSKIERIRKHLAAIRVYKEYT